MLGIPLDSHRIRSQDMFETWATRFSDSRVRRFWVLGLAALLLHTVLDPLLTYLAVNVFEVGVETNLWLATYLNQGLFMFTLIHLPLYLGVFLMMGLFTWLFSRASESEATQLYWLSVVIWSGIILWGILIVGNNLWVLLHGS